MKIFVNLDEFDFFGSQISYEEVVRLTGMSGTPSVVYRSRRDGDSQRSGIMYPGCKPVELDEGMAFSVAHTGSA